MRPSLPRARASSKTASRAAASGTLTRCESAKRGGGGGRRLEWGGALTQVEGEERLDGLVDGGARLARALGENVEGDIDDGNRFAHVGRRRLAPEAGLELEEGHRAAVLEREDLAVEDGVPGQPAGGLGDLGELPGHVVEVA